MNERTSSFIIGLLLLVAAVVLAALRNRAAPPQPPGFGEIAILILATSASGTLFLIAVTGTNEGNGILDNLMDGDIKAFLFGLLAGGAALIVTEKLGKVPSNVAHRLSTFAALAGVAGQEVWEAVLKRIAGG